MMIKHLVIFCFAFSLIVLCETQGKKEAALSRNPPRTELSHEFVEYYNHGLELIRSEDYLGAVEAFKQAIEIDPSCEEAYDALGTVYLTDLAQTIEAIEAFQTVIQLVPNHARAHQMLGIAYFRQNAYQKAIRSLRRAIELEPGNLNNDYHPYYNLGMVYLKQNKFDDAIQLFEQAIQLNLDHIRAYYSLGTAYIRAGHVEKGVEQIKKYEALKPYANRVSQLETSIQRSPKNPELLYQLGLVHLRYGKFELAIKSLVKSIKQNPNDREVYNTLAACYMRLNDFKKMQQACEAAVRLTPNEANGHNNLGMSYSLQGKYFEAINSFLMAIQLDAENPKFHQNLRKVYERLGDVEKAAHEFKTVQQLQARQENRGKAGGRTGNQ